MKACDLQTPPNHTRQNFTLKPIESENGEEMETQMQQ